MLTRTMILRIHVLAWALGLWLTTPACADWPQFRGPQGDGHADPQLTQLPITWNASTNIAWQTEIPGHGWSSPIVVGDRIWLTTAEETALTTLERNAKLAANPFAAEMQAHGDVKVFAVEIDARSGKLLRKLELAASEQPAPIHANNSYASTTPVTDGARLICHFGTLGTVCLAIPAGKVLWKRTFALDYMTGVASSPVLFGQQVILTCDAADEQFVIALDKQTGETIWRTARPKLAASDKMRHRAFSTPLVITHHDQAQLIVPGAQWVVSYDPTNGKEIWRANFGDCYSTVPRPVYSAGLVYICTGYTKPTLAAIRVDGSGDVTATHIAWQVEKQVPEIASPLVDQGLLYMVSAKGIATCLDAKTGESVWQERLGGNYSASPLLAAGQLYFTSQEGTTHVLSPGRTFRELAKNQLFGHTRASLAVYDKSLLLRTDTQLYRINE